MNINTSYLEKISSYLPSSATLNNIGFGTAGAALATLYYATNPYAALPATLASLASLGAAQVKKIEEDKKANKNLTEKYLTNILNFVEECINHPDNKYSPETQGSLKNLVENLRKNKYSVEIGDDKLRLKYVPAQASIEHALYLTILLHTGQTKPTFVGAIHTPTPATPLCTPAKGEIILTLLDPAIQNDREKIKTVADRTQTVRGLATVGTLYIAYPKGGLEKRKEEEQNAYKEALSQYPKLKDTVLNEQLPDDMTGASYVLEMQDGVQILFSLRGAQANNPTGNTWGIWLGSKFYPEVLERMNHVSSTLQNLGAPQMWNLEASKLWNLV